MAHDERKWHRRLFRTAHRLLLERAIFGQLPGLTGEVLVIGAGYEPYRRMLTGARGVCLTDIDPANNAVDRQMDAHEITFADESFDSVLAIEVFEHLRRPAVAAAEIRRVLRPGGTCLLSIPFLFRVHGDPFDFQRLTGSGLEELFRDFSRVSVVGFGRRSHVISDIVTTGSRALVPLRIVNHLLARLPAGPSHDSPSGYIVRLVK